MIQVQPRIAALAPYALAELNAPPGKRLISLAQNESYAPPSPKAWAAAAETLGTCQLYPDPDWTDLRSAIAEVHGLKPARLLCGAGSMELIGAIISCYAGPDASVLSSQYAYAYFRSAALAAGARYDAAPESDFTVDTSALLESVKSDTRVVCIANPGNPTGTRIPNAALRRLRADLPDDILLVIDEAYGEFTARDDAALFDLVEAENSVVLRTFSKAYALAGARVGWGLFPERVGAEVRKLLNPNNVSSASQAAAAAAMRDQAYMRSLCQETAERRNAFSRSVKAFGLRAVPSSTNFVLIVFSSPDAAASANEALRAEGVVLRAMGGYGLPQCLRATIASEGDMETATTLLSQHLERVSR